MEYKAMYGKWVVRNRWLIIIISIAVLLVSAAGGRYITFINDGRVFFNKNDPYLIALEEIENSYTKEDNIYFALESKEGDTIFTKKALAAGEELTKRAWQIPYSSRVDSLTNFQHTRANEDDLIVEDLVRDAASLNDEEILRIKDIALADPTLRTRLVSPSGDMMGINVNILKPGRSNGETSEVMAFVDKMVMEFRRDFPYMNIYITGGLPFDNAFGEVSMDDMSKLVPTMYLVIIALIWALLRTAGGAFATLLVIAFSCVTAIGLTGWLGITLTPASVSSPTIILTLSVADSIHILATMYQEMLSGRTRHEAIIESMRINMQPVFLTSLTTAIGFLSMNASDAPPFRDLGNIVAIGVTAAFLYSILFLPALVSVLPVRVKKKKKGAHAAIDSLGDFVVRRRNLLFWGMLAMIIFFISGIHRIDLNDRFIEYFDRKYPIRTDTDYITENGLTGMDIIEYSIGAGESNGIVNPEYLNHLDALAEWFKNQPSVIHVDTFTNVMKRVNRSMHGDNDEYYRVPENRSLAAQFLLLYEMSLPFGLDLNNQINVDKSATRFLVTAKRLSTKELRALEERAREWMRQNLPEYMRAYGSGISIVWAHISERNINTMLNGTFIALILISVILILALKSWKYGIISLIPNLIPAFMAFGLWGYLVGEAGLAVSIIGAISLGIVVDDTIHFLTKYLRARKEFGMTSEEAIKRSFHTVGTAIITTTVVLVSGFLVLTLSGFLLNSAMGFLTAIALIFALIADCFFLPTLLMRVD